MEPAQRVALPKGVAPCYALLMRQVVKLLGSCATLVLLTTAPTWAWAIDRQFLLGGHLSYAHEFGDESRPGGGVGAHARYFLTDYVAVGGNVEWAMHAAQDAAGELEARQVIDATVGIFFFADIIRIVPYAGLLAGVAVSLQDQTEVAYLAQATLGAFVLATPSFTTGLEVSYQLLVGEEILPARLVVSLQFGWRHIFF